MSWAQYNTETVARAMTEKLKDVVGEPAPRNMNADEISVSDYIRRLHLELIALRQTVAQHPEIRAEFKERMKVLTQEAKARKAAKDAEDEECVTVST